MSVHNILILPDPLLRKVSEPVRSVDREVRQLADDMFATMYDAPGIGLAAIQIGRPLRVFTLDVSKKDSTSKEPLVFINPQITWSSEEISSHDEGCLSIPEYFAEVERPAKVRVRFLDLHAKAQEIEAEGILATCIQHEFDHLNGVLFIDHISKLKRMMVMKRFTKQARLREAGV